MDPTKTTRGRATDGASSIAEARRMMSWPKFMADMDARPYDPRRACEALRRVCLPHLDGR